MNYLNSVLIFAIFLMSAKPAFALPINFGYNQGPHEFSEIITPEFHIYHDKNVEMEAMAVAEALEKAVPVLSVWFETSLVTPMPVVMSAVSSNASFANFLTNAIELQTLGQGGRDLAWHEMTHSQTYRNVTNFLGHAGAIVHLPWMPAWFLEGLAESTSVSVGSDVMSGIERYQALSGDWPTYDRLHSLYHSGQFAERGYATSGAFTTWILHKAGPAKLSTILNDFHDYTMPWWWPWSVVPFNNFLPMDQALENQLGQNSEDLYELYKKESQEFWRKHPGKFYAGTSKDQRKFFSSVGGLTNLNGKLYQVVDGDDQRYEAEIVFTKGSPYATAYKKVRDLPEGYGAATDFWTDDYKVFVRTTSESLKRTSTLDVTINGKTETLTIDGTIVQTYVGAKNLYWQSWHYDRQQVCFVPKLSVQSKPTCPFDVRHPESLKFLGASSRDKDQIWIAKNTETLTGNRHEIWTLKGAERNKLNWETGSRPLQLVEQGGLVHVLAAEFNRRSVVSINAKGECQTIAPLKDHVLTLHGHGANSLVFGIYAGSRRLFVRVPRTLLAKEPCYKTTSHKSPLLAAMQLKTTDITQSYKEAQLWTYATAIASPVAKRIQQQPAIGSSWKPVSKSDEAKWRGRPIFGFPWIGADDALGSQIGIVSVPLVDEMQNETIRTTLLYGVPSNFPYQDISITSTRFKPTLNFSMYRQQTYNGRFVKLSSGEIFSSYYDEKGGKFDMSYGTRFLGGSLGVGAGMKYAHLKPYIGPMSIRRGFLAEFSLSLSSTHVLGPFSWSKSIDGRAAPESMNEKWDYNQVGVSTTLGMGLFWSSRFSLGLEGSRMRGKLMRDLKELYRPLKTFVPGSGGGYNKNSFPVAGSGGLFSAQFGDTQARAKANWSVPVIHDIDYLFWILYVERLDFSAFYNYGGAWFGDEPSVGFDKLTRAHGYSLDLQLENKGVRFNLGAGTGQVIGDDFEVYLTTGFDALF